MIAPCVAESSARLCGFCLAELPTTDPRAVYCGRRCRQAAFRARRLVSIETSPLMTGPGVFAYADPPYPGLSRKYYGDEPTYAGEVDHEKLIASLEYSRYAGWALSTSEKALRTVLPMCPAGARVCAWTKPHGVPSTTRGIHGAWEPVIVVGGRQRRPGVRNHLSALPARLGGSTLMGRKPLAFSVWLFALLGMQPGDTLIDLFPGSGAVSAAWRAVSSGAALNDGGDRG
jgi:hypothetical protein